jgi:UBX domain-containing protein 1
MSDDDADSNQPSTANYSGPRTLDGRPAPESAAEPSGAKAGASSRRAQGGMRTLRDIQGHPEAGHDQDDDDSDDENQDLYAGGEKSGLSVQNPGSARDPQAAIREMMRRAGQ